MGNLDDHFSLSDALISKRSARDTFVNRSNNDSAVKAKFLPDEYSDKASIETVESYKNNSH